MRNFQQLPSRVVYDDVAPGTVPKIEQIEIDKRPFVSHIKSSYLIKDAETWCKANLIDFHYGMPNPMYWYFVTSEARDAFIKSGFAELGEEK